MEKTPRLSVIIPAFNEGENIYKNLLEVASSLDPLGIGFEIVLVDDGSADDTLAEARRASEADSRIRIARNFHNLGKGWALKTGFNRCRGEVVAFLDADLDIPPAQMGILLEKLDSGGFDVVIGSKLHPGSQLGYPLYRKFFSFCYYLFIKFLFDLPLRDTQTGIKLWRRPVLADIFPHVLVKKFAFDIELLALSHYMGFSVAEVPVIIDFRRALRWGRISLVDIYQILLDTLAIFYRLKILHYYDRELPVIDHLPRVSIVIAVGPYNDNLVESIEACLRLDYPDFEVLVFPDEPFDWPDERVRVVPTGKVIGPSPKRDLALTEATGEILAFLDDDAYPVTGWLTNAVRNFSRPEVAAVGGPAVTPPSDNILQQASGDIYASPLVGGTYSYRYIQGRYREVEDYPTCNLLVRKSVFERVGGFDTGYWPGEDTIFCLKIIRDLGMKIVYEPDAIVYHHRREVYLGHLRQIVSYAMHRGYFVKRFPETSLKPAYFLPSLFVAGLGLGPVAAVLWPPLWYAYGAVVAVYLIVVAGSAAMVFSPRRAWYVFSGTVLSHLGYGVYFIRGLLARRLKDERLDY
ncbi:MAG: glycosyltransferase [Gemmatimonadota bacterium]|nr:glycosyltransferase [Gemmatimonadota bacterium]